MVGRRIHSSCSSSWLFLFFKNLFYFVFVFFLILVCLCIIIIILCICIYLPLKYLEFVKPLDLNSLLNGGYGYVCVCRWCASVVGLILSPFFDVLAHDVGMHTSLLHDIPGVKSSLWFFVILTIICRFLYTLQYMVSLWRCAFLSILPVFSFHVHRHSIFSTPSSLAICYSGSLKTTE